MDDSTIVVIESEGGRTGIVEFGWNRPYTNGPEACVQVFDTRGYARLFPSEAKYGVLGRWVTATPESVVPYDTGMTCRREIDHFVECACDDVLAHLVYALVDAPLAFVPHQPG